MIVVSVQERNAILEEVALHLESSLYWGCEMNADRCASAVRMLQKPVPICKVAQENGGTVPLECLFKCERRCMEDQPPRVSKRPHDPDPNDFDVVQE